MPYIEYYDEEPSLDTLLEIEGIAIIEENTPAVTTGVSVNVLAVVGEFTKYQDDPVEVVNSTDLKKYFGSFSKNVGTHSTVSVGGKTYHRFQGNGNLMLSNQKVKRLVCVAVDDSSVELTFTRQNPGTPTIESSSGPFSFYGLSSPATLDLRADSDSGTDTTVNLAFAPASHTGGTGTFVTATTDKKLSIVVDGVTYERAADNTANTLELWVAWFNNPTYFPGLKMVKVDSDTVKIVSDKQGSDAQFQILAAGSGSSSEVIASLGITAGTYSGSGDVADHLNVSAEEIVTAINATVDLDVMYAAAVGTKVQVYSKTDGTFGSIQCKSSSTADSKLGGSFATNANSAGGDDDNPDAVIPAGTIVQVDANNQFETMMDCEFVDGDLSVSGIKARALQSGTTTSNTITSFETAPSGSGLVNVTVTNPSGSTARASTETEWALLYTDAFNKLKSQDAPASYVSLVTHLRVASSANTAADGLIQDALKTCVTDMRSGGNVVIGITSPPLGTTKSVAKGNTGSGVGNVGRDQYVFYAYPGVASFYPQLISAGINKDGMCDTPFCLHVAALCSLMDPEKNPGEPTNLMTWKRLEAATRSAGTIGALEKTDYIAFKAAGIMAPRIDNGFKLIQSGVTSVDPLLVPRKKNANTVRMNQYMTKTFASLLSPFSKKIASQENIDAAEGALNGFLEPLKNGKKQRIFDYKVVPLSIQSETSLNLSRFGVSVTMLGTMDKIALNTNIGADVVISED